MSKQSVVRSSPRDQFLRGFLRVSLKKGIRGVRSRLKSYGEDIAVGLQCELKTLRVRQCVIIRDSN
jgi:hypothetical protein